MSYLDDSLSMANWNPMTRLDVTSDENGTGNGSVLCWTGLSFPSHFTELTVNAEAEAG